MAEEKATQTGMGPGGPAGTREVRVRLSEETARGAYSNAVGVTHSDHEFVLDFALVVGSSGSVVSRVVLSPAQAKRLAVTLQDHVGRFEHAHGSLDASSGPAFQIGFQPSE
jgi:hypothetical protein